VVTLLVALAVQVALVAPVAAYLAGSTTDLAAHSVQIMGPVLALELVSA